MNRLAMIGGLTTLIALAGCGESVDQYDPSAEANLVVNDTAVIDASPDGMATNDTGLPGDGAMALDNSVEARAAIENGVEPMANAPQPAP